MSLAYSGFRLALLGIVLVAPLAAGPASAEEGPTEVTGKAALAHPAGRAFVEAAKLLRAGKLAAVKEASVKEVRDEWAATSAADQRELIDSARERAPEPATLEAEIARAGVLTNYGDSAKLYVESADHNTTIVGFASLEGGKWKVTAGPFAIDSTPVVETAPAIEGAAILEHEIGKLALAYSTAITAGRIDQAMELATAAARQKRLALSAADRKDDEAYRRNTTPAPKDFAAQIRAGGRLSFMGDRAVLAVVANTTTRNPDGSITSSSSSTTVGFATENGKWRIAE